MKKKTAETVKIFGLDFFSNNEEELLKRLVEGLERGKRFLVFTPNPEFVIASQEDRSFLETLQRADFLLPDGVGIIWAKKVLAQKSRGGRFWRGLTAAGEIWRGGGGKEKITGADLMEKLCGLAAQKGWRVFLLGGEKDRAVAALAKLQKKFPGLEGAADAGPENIERLSQRREKFWVEKINRQKPVLLFAGLGMKKQENFLAENWQGLTAGLAMGVGGAFDYWSGRVTRAPESWRQRGGEWFFRLIHQPWRFKRQLALAKFVWRVVCQGETGNKG